MLQSMAPPLPSSRTELALGTDLELSANCRTTMRECNYQVPNLPLGAQKWQAEAVPGTSLWQLPKGAPLDPFDTLPIQMEHGSRELFHYFAGVRYEPTCSKVDFTELMANYELPAEIALLVERSRPASRVRDPMTSAIDECTGLRSTLMLAGLHFTLVTSGASHFDDTFLAHKGDVIRYVNEGLGNHILRNRASFVKVIATLSVMESCVGNLVVAEAHLRGLMSLLEMQDSAGRPAVNQTRDVDAQTVQRMFVMAHHFLDAVRSRSTDTQTQESNKTEKRLSSGLMDNLAALRLMPVFFSSIPPKMGYVDASAIIAALKGFTQAVVAKASSRKLSKPASGRPECSCEGADAESCLGCRSSAGMLVGLLITHFTDLPPALDGHNKRMRSTWCALAISCSFYLNTVLGAWNRGIPPEPRLLARLLALHKTELDRMELDLLSGSESCNTWFWQIFVAAMTLQAVRKRHSRHVGAAHYMSTTEASEGEPSFDPYMYHTHIRRWSVISRTKQWEGARVALQQVAWPDLPWAEEMANGLWEEAMTI
ncbi:hypothetical protein GQ53DRAFT_418019 [Thozetella sp. PMI_491]|nr:hypothetical protein GQ53DRAFT_418019 [Thozetella sp. PMI_491]